ncbi:NAD-dependent epimerase/dehydratase family protein [Papillibacter cinnamivorans]|uniref:Dihydroflavonol-4-reductase n=1 Tax=Papillibacter cinnamivorans DSM 12816 TaxID=1122930 RepID=A0A1W1ZFL4_9FIRM|nr:NAD-dependent epimerase/dehydratase family protein [Papillibacter cinnamivorans]SMC47136.1 dihydroflavonol-4-reductase [Papillibacter cinnamivorans DSM 12816]
MNGRLYLLTGATGLLGGNIVRELIARGERVRALALPKDTAISGIPHGVEVVEGGLLDVGALDRFFSVPETDELIVIHAAGIVTMDPEPSETVRAVNVDGTGNIIEKCLQYKVKKLVYISSTSVIPELPSGQVIREVEDYDPDKVIGYYAKTKAMATGLVMKAVRKNGLDASVVCPSGIFGPNDYGFGMITSALIMVAEGKLRISVGGTFNSVDARDLAAGIIACAERGRKGEAYIMASRCYTFSQLMDAICKEAGAKKYLFTVPLWLVRPFAGLGTLYGRMTKKPAWFSRFTVYNLARNNDYSAEKAERELGFRCRSLDESIADTVRWLKREGKIHPNVGS